MTSGGPLLLSTCSIALLSFIFFYKITLSSVNVATSLACAGFACDSWCSCRNRAWGLRRTIAARATFTKTFGGNAFSIPYFKENFP